jgi:hypothetical protein
LKFNIAFCGPEPIFHLRRDFLLALKYGLESLGHAVTLSGLTLSQSHFNLIIGAYFLPPARIKEIETLGVRFGHVNTEVIAHDMLNFNPAKTDFLGAYLPSMQAGEFVWDVIMDNLGEHRRYGNNAHFLRWGWHPKIEDIEHKAEKDLDFYFFGLMSDRRVRIVEDLLRRKLTGFADHSCPYFVRNDRIARSKVNLNIVQDEKYTHVNSFRICYLANNRCAILSEAENDPAGYLDYATIVTAAELGDAVAEACASGAWRQSGEDAYQKFRELPMTRCLEELVERTFSKGK